MQTIIQKIKNGIRLDREEGLKLYDLDFFTLGQLANDIRVKMYNNEVYYNVNRHINPTNICKDTCKFCAFSAHRKNPNPYTMSHEEILNIVEASAKKDITEVHIVSAHNNKVTLDWYMDIFKKIKTKFPHIHVKALTAAEVDFLAKEHNKSYDEIVDIMIENGVDSMPGGGAEIFDETVREKICRGKITSDDWMRVHKTWHKRGKKSNATMLFGHIEDRSHRIDHMIRLRETQDKSGGFNAFIPLVYQRENNFLDVKEFLSSVEILKTYAIARILLDNIPHIKAYWVTSTINLALVAQNFGCDDLDGTIEKESINSAAGAKSSFGMKETDFLSLIKNSDFKAVQRDSLYNHV